jgi:hypothetical protein
METTIQVRQHSSLTLTVDLRQKFGIQEGDTFRLLDLDGIFVLTPNIPIVPELAAEIERAHLEAGISSCEMFISLRDMPEKYHPNTSAEKAYTTRYN